MNLSLVIPFEVLVKLVLQQGDQLLVCSDLEPLAVLQFELEPLRS